MERLNNKEINLVIDALARRKDDLAKLPGEKAGDDVQIYEALIKIFEEEKKTEMERSQEEAEENFDLKKIREDIDKDK